MSEGYVSLGREEIEGKEEEDVLANGIREEEEEERKKRKKEPFLSIPSAI